MDIVRIGEPSKEAHPPTMIGAKAANLERMAALGLPVPPAFVLPIRLCTAAVRGDPDVAGKLAESLKDGIAFLESATGRRFGDRRRPLLVSVRSGAARSMPGMLDTVLNVGCTADAVRGLIRTYGDPRFAGDCRRRFLESYGGVVLGIEGGAFASRLQGVIAAEGADSTQTLDSEALERLVAAYEDVIEQDNHGLAPEPMDQLKSAADAVYRSWMSERAVVYRKLQRLDDLTGTAVTVQAMVYGNCGFASGSGVAFSRDPSTGAAAPVIDVLFASQGEDVVSGSRTPDTEAAIARSLPVVAAQLREALTRLEDEFADVQDVEFTIENGKLWLLQTRAAKRTPQAAVRFAIDFVKEGRITPAQALQRLDSIDLTALVTKHLVDAGTPAARGIGASAGIAVGRAAFDPASAVRLSTTGDPIILVRPDTTTADVAGFAVAAGIVTAVGGRTAHAALVARQMGKPCIVGCAALAVHPAQHRACFNGAALNEGDWLTIDGETGAIHLGHGTVITERPAAELKEIAHWRAST
jgi:pyruvate, orthophosphate dikinase